MAQGMLNSDISLLYQVLWLDDNCIQRFIWGGISSDTWLEILFNSDISEVIKINFWPCIWQHTSQNENFEYGYQYSFSVLLLHTSKSPMTLLMILYLRQYIS